MFTEYFFTPHIFDYENCRSGFPDRQSWFNALKCFIDKLFVHNETCPTGTIILDIKDKDIDGVQYFDKAIKYFVAQNQKEAGDLKLLHNKIERGRPLRYGFNVATGSCLNGDIVTLTDETKWIDALKKVFDVEIIKKFKIITSKQIKGSNPISQTTALCNVNFTISGSNTSLTRRLAPDWRQQIAIMEQPSRLASAISIVDPYCLDGRESFMNNGTWKHSLFRHDNFVMGLHLLAEKVKEKSGNELSTIEVHTCLHHLEMKKCRAQRDEIKKKLEYEILLAIKNHTQKTFPGQVIVHVHKKINERRFFFGNVVSDKGFIPHWGFAATHLSSQSSVDKKTGNPPEPNTIPGGEHHVFSLLSKKDMENDYTYYITNAKKAV